ALGIDLVTPGAVAREQRQPVREAAPFRMRPGDLRPRAQRRDIGDERTGLAVREEHAAAAWLHARARDRHVAGAEVEVRRDRADPSQLRPELRLTVPVAAVTHHAVPSVELVAVLAQ